MQLFVLPGACSLSCHIALQAVTMANPKRQGDFDIVVLNREQRENLSAPYLSINPLGTVPALVTTEGDVLLECMAILFYIAQKYPDANLAPPAGSTQSDRVFMLLSAMVTTCQPAFQMLWRTERFADTHDAQASVQRMCRVRLKKFFDRLEKEIGLKCFLCDVGPNIADMYLFTLARWGLRLEPSTKCYPRIWNFTKNMASLPFVAAAMRREGVELESNLSSLG